MQQLTVHFRLNGAHDKIRVRSQHVGQKQFVPIPVSIQRFIKGDLYLLIGDLAQVHEYLVFNTARGICSQFDPFGYLERLHRFD